jgi:hypothetical protein
VILPNRASVYAKLYINESHSSSSLGISESTVKSHLYRIPLVPAALVASAHRTFVLQRIEGGARDPRSARPLLISAHLT